MDSLVYQASTPPSDNTRLSLSLRPVLRDSMILTGVSSVAVYQYNRSLVMIDVSPDSNLARDPHVNYNFLSPIKALQELLYIDVGFSCVASGTNPHDIYIRLLCFVGDFTLAPYVFNSPYKVFSGDNILPNETENNRAWEACKFISLRLSIHTCSD